MNAEFFGFGGGTSGEWLVMLVEASLKGSLVFGAGWLAVVVPKKAAAATRHLILVLTLGSALALPLFSIVLPKWEVLAVVAAQWEVGAQAESRHPLEAPRAERAARASRAEDAPRAERARRAEGPPRLTMERTVLLGWAAGVMLMLIPLLRSARALRKLELDSPLITSGPIAGMVAVLAKELGLRRRVTVLGGAEDAMPMAWGIWRARLLLPSGAQDWPASRLRAVLVHEMAHLLRRDPATAALGLVSRAVYWFNPLSWVLVHRMRAEQEQACDDEVIRRGSRASDYAADLVDIASGARPAVADGALALSMARPGKLEARVGTILAVASNRNGLKRWGMFAGSVFALMVVLPLSMLRAAQSGDEGKDGDVLIFDERVYECELHPRNVTFLDLETGGFEKSQPPGDIYLTRSESDSRVHPVTELQLVAVPVEKWESATPAEVFRNAATARAGAEERLGSSTEAPRVWIFKTGDGNAGILRLEPRKNRPGSVIVQSKLVRPRREFRMFTTVLPRGESGGELDLNRAIRIERGSTEGAGASVANHEGKWYLRVKGTHSYLGQMEHWRSLTAEEVAEPAGLAGAPPERDTFYELSTEKLPVIILVPGYGILKVQETGEVGEKATMLSYKYVQEKKWSTRPTAREAARAETVIDPGRDAGVDRAQRQR